jgi:hypothetical protein
MALDFTAIDFETANSYRGCVPHVASTVSTGRGRAIRPWRASGEHPASIKAAAGLT